MLIHTVYLAHVARGAHTLRISIAILGNLQWVKVLCTRASAKIVVCR